jgi:phenylalanyl-tRNA synthetase beta chain
LLKLCILAGYEEKKHLSLFLTGNRNQENITETVGFFCSKGFIFRILSDWSLKKQNFVLGCFFSEGFLIGNETILEFGIVKNRF